VKNHSVPGTRTVLKGRIYEINVQDLLGFETIAHLEQVVREGCPFGVIVNLYRGIITINFPAKLSDSEVRNQIAKVFERWDGPLEDKSTLVTADALNASAETVKKENSL
jgi:hypothetical protein